MLDRNPLRFDDGTGAVTLVPPTVAAAIPPDPLPYVEPEPAPHPITDPGFPPEEPDSPMPSIGEEEPERVKDQPIMPNDTPGRVAIPIEDRPPVNRYS